MKLQIPHTYQPKFSTISRRKAREFDELTLVFKELENSFMKLEELHVKEMKGDGRKLIGDEKKQE